MGGTRRLTWATAVTLAVLMVGTSVIGVLAKEQGQGRGQGHGPAAVQDEGEPRGRGLGLLKQQEQNQEEEQEEEELEDISVASVTEPATPTDAAKPERECADELSEVEEFGWLNHGHYVSCVARGLTPVEDEGEHENHGSVVSEAAQSDIGKDGEGEEESGGEEE